MNDLPPERQGTIPDKYTLAWWQRQFAEIQTGYRGATHGINRALALYDDFLAETAAIRKRVEILERERSEDRAKIGELAARVERMAEFLNKQRNGNGFKESNL